MSHTPPLPEQPPASLSAETAQAVEALEAELSLLWRRARSLNHTLTRQVHPDLEPAAYGLLSVLMHRGAMRLTDLAKAIGVGKPSVSRQIKFLEEIGLVVKSADVLDGRAQLIALSDTGLAKMREVNAGRRNAFHNFLATWETQEVESLAKLIAKLNHNELG